METKALKQKILDLAIHGKLVPQDPNDEPATVFIDNFIKEKKILLDSKSIKKNKFDSIINFDDKHWIETYAYNKSKKCIDNDIPFNIPLNWAWCRLSSIASFIGDGIHGTPIYSNNGTFYFINGNNLENGQIAIKKDTKRVDFQEAEKYKKPLDQNTILVSINGTLGNIAFYRNENIILGKSACYVTLMKGINKNFIRAVLETKYFKDYAINVSTGNTIKNVPLSGIRNFLIPFPSQQEQKRIVARINELFSIIDKIEESKANLIDDIDKTKDKIIELAVNGKLVPKASQWKEYTLGDLLPYEQPQKYIVSSTKYSDEYETPVLTAGKTFILGYTNETNNICDSLPCIIFDDFTTDCKYVDFKFKVKSSAMKILHPRNDMDPRFLYYLVKNNKEKNISHKRYWISIVSQKRVKVPPLEEQQRIVSKVEQLFTLLDKIKGNVQ